MSMMAVVLLLFSLAVNFYHAEGITCPVPVCDCSSYNVLCDVGFKDEFPVIKNTRGDITIVGNENITDFPNGTFSNNRMFSLTITKTSISHFACDAFQELQGVRHVVLLDNALTAVPSCALSTTAFQSSVISYLKLDGNSIESISAADFTNLTGLRSLDLRNNMISHLEPGVFSNLTGLMTLWLNGNKLTYLSGDLFPGLSQLSTLHLENNSITTISTTAFRSMDDLSSLFLSDNKIEMIDRGWFVNKTYFHRLNLQNNKISAIDDGIFNSLCFLRYLNLTLNNLEILPNMWYDSSCYGVLLNTLDIDFNQISEIRENAFENFNFLSVLNLRGNRLRVIRRESFNGATNLLTLRLSNNSIETFEPLAFRGLDDLTTIYLNYNNLQEITSWDFGRLESLRYLYLKGNQISRLDQSAFEGLELLRVLNLKNNKLNSLSLQQLHNSLFHVNQLSTLDLSSNPITQLPMDTFEFVPKLLNLYLSNCKLSKFPNEALRFLTSLQNLDLSGNSLRMTSKEDQTLTFTTSAYHPSINLANNHLTVIYLHVIGLKSFFVPQINASVNNLVEMNVFIDQIGRDVFPSLYLADNKLSKPVLVTVGGNITNLQILNFDLSANNFGDFPLDVQVVNSSAIWYPCISNKVGNVTVGIQTLTLDSNGLEEPASRICLSYASKLEFNNNGVEAFQSSWLNHSDCRSRDISLQRNNLTELPLGPLIDQCKSLHTVRLQNNAISDLNKLKSVANQSSVSIRLADNPIHCGCDLLWLRHYPIIDKLTDARCSSPEAVIGFKPYCFPDYACFNRSAINASSPVPSQCDQDRYVTVHKVSVTRNDNSLIVTWAASGPGDIDHFIVRKSKGNEASQDSVRVPWNVTSATLVGPPDNDYTICVSAQGSRVSRESQERCYDVIGLLSAGSNSALALGVSLGVGIPVIIIVVVGVVVYRRRKNAGSANVGVN